MTETRSVQIARNFRALSHPRRVLIFRLLADAPGKRLSYQAIQRHLKLCDSSLIHHLREMERCGLLARTRRGVFADYGLTPASLQAEIGVVGHIAAGNAEPLQQGRAA